MVHLFGIHRSQVIDVPDGGPLLLARVERRDPSALVELVAAYDATLVRFANLVTGSRDDAYDAAQAVWERVWMHPPTLRSEGALRPWLLSVARHDMKLGRYAVNRTTSAWNGAETSPGRAGHSGSRGRSRCRRDPRRWASPSVCCSMSGNSSR